MFTPGQQSKYRPLVERAWQAHCLRTGQNPDVDSAHETWYRQQLMDACGIYSTRQANPVQDYDVISLHFAEIAGDDKAIAYFSKASERRLQFLIQGKLDRLTDATGTIHDWSYVQGVYSQAKMMPSIQDAPARHLYKIHAMLDTHVRRVEQKQSSRQVALPA